MQQSEELNLLIDKAASIIGSDYKVAQILEVPRHHISEWRKGRRTCTPADQALLAHLAGLDPVQMLARATVAQNEGKRKGDLLMRALGKSLLATGAAVASAGASAASIYSTIPAVPKLVGWLLHNVYYV